MAVHSKLLKNLLNFSFHQDNSGENPTCGRGKKKLEKTKLEQMKFALEDWGLNTKTHAVSNIFRLESRLLRIIWLLCFLASLIYCIIAVTTIIMDYLSYNVLINQQVENVSPVDFPAGN
jgi:hypothetical protein